MFSNLKKSEKIIIEAVLVLFFIIWLYPIIQSVIESLKIKGISNYVAVLNHPKINYPRVLFNSFFIAASSSFVVTFISSLAGYAFSKLEFHFKNVLYYLLIACLAIPPASVMTPMFSAAKNLHLMDTYGSIILPLVAFNSPFMLMVIKNYFDSIPDSIIEAATIDGCSTFRIYATMMMPLGIPAVINVLVLTFIYSWNDFLIPLLFVRKESMYTVTLAAQYFTAAKNQTPEMVAQLYAALMLMTLPSMIIYIFGQKYLQSGLTAGSVKE
ncbi:MAG TPA: carbohydrate ABC transporter permease [Clostridiaceae bacterium]|nr:carbohydrate ABC transporter permease [Clostridiaceae bacterium]